MDSTLDRKPKITVLMPVYNCELYIKEALESILNQTFSDFELLIIDDASSDSTVSIIKNYNDSRLRLIEKDKNSGITNSLNYGLSIARGEYIARMDGDDISFPERFEKQVAFLDANPEIILCGTNYKVIGKNENIILPECNESIKIRLLRDNCIAHPSVMMRRQKLIESSVLYDPIKESAEDYDLWVRLLAFGKLYNLQDFLLQYRVHEMQISKKRQKQQNESALECRIKMIDYLNFSFHKEETLLLKKFVSCDTDFGYDEVQKIFTLKEKLVAGNSKLFFNNDELKKYLTELEIGILKKYFIARQKYSPAIFFQYLKYKRSFRLTFINEIKLLIKSFVCHKVH
ncbi:glycosyltransferase [Flavobacterium johnsoniae]|uniref:glycosyltransferase family 2 protein n=1 Tax=Flavobacterium johnsoniae TaxID=986 RepID=UPI0025B25602|nr:glycosyltransferase [Flavobacterium johnsoniae]WJS95137.1 glycosyltransferase [Flavobacterium johnsoniae]